MFICTGLLINNCVSAERRASMNGLSLTTTALLRTCMDLGLYLCVDIVKEGGVTVGPHMLIYHGLRIL